MGIPRLELLLLYRLHSEGTIPDFIQTSSQENPQRQEGLMVKFLHMYSHGSYKLTHPIAGRARRDIFGFVEFRQECV